MKSRFARLTRGVQGNRRDVVVYRETGPAWSLAGGHPTEGLPHNSPNTNRRHTPCQGKDLKSTVGQIIHDLIRTNVVLFFLRVIVCL